MKINLKDYVKQIKRISIKELRNKLMAENPHCYWCGIKVRDDYEQFTRPLKRGERFPDDMATIDHLYDRLDPENRYKVYENNEDKVLACYRCNQGRAIERNKQLGKEEQTRRVLIGQERAAKKDRTPRVLLFYNNED